MAQRGALAEALATPLEIKKSQGTKLIDTLATIATAQVKKTGKFTLPGLCMIKTRLKPATKAGKREKIDKMHVKATKNFIGPKHWKDIPGVKEGWQ